MTIVIQLRKFHDFHDSTAVILWNNEKPGKLSRLEMVQRSAARVVLCLRRRDQHSLTVALRELQWLPVAQLIQFNLLSLMHGAVHANTPRYLADRISP